MWRKVIPLSELNGSYCFKHRRKEIAVFKLPDGSVHALDNACSHEYSPLCEGFVYNDHVYCPKHGSQFDIRTGEVKGPPATSPVKVFSIMIEDGYIHVNC